MSITKFKGIIPAFYACYDDNGDISEERTKQYANYMLDKDVKGLYVGGSSGECIYQTIEERKLTLKYVAEAVQGKFTLIAHVGALSTRDSQDLAQYAEELGYDALSAIPPIYYNLPEHSIYRYWTDIVESTSLPFIIYNIPQTTGYNLSLDLFSKMLEHKKVIGVKNSSMPAMDIERFKVTAGEEFIVFNGPDEQFVSGRLIGADGGIGGTYGVMPELFLQANQYVQQGQFNEARAIQHDINNIIVALTSQRANMYAVIKAILKYKGMDVGSVRAPFEPVSAEEQSEIEAISKQIDQTILKYQS